MKKTSNPPRKAKRGTGWYVLFLFMVLGVGTVAGWIHQSDILVGIVKRVFSPQPPEKTFGANTVTLLILGCDELRSDKDGHIIKKQARSDMMLIAKLDFKNHLITGVSIPRDTECNLPGYKHGQKVNAFHSFAKKGHEAELTMKAVQFLLPGVQIDRVVTLDFDAFQDVVNLVGGVPITVDKDMNYDDFAGQLHIHLKKGAQHMNGFDAMCFVRFRHADSDFVRQARQKQFLIAFKGQVLSHWVQLPSIIDDGAKVIGGALNSDEISSLALFAKSVPTENIQWGQIPVVDGRGTNLDIDEEKLPGVLAQYRLIDAPGVKVAQTSSEVR